jgi:hypothetical protein
LKSNLRTRRSIIGPNIPIEKPELARLILQTGKCQVLVPSESMRQILLDRELGYVAKDILVWAAGVNHKYWVPSANNPKSIVLVYQKGPESQHRVDEVIQLLHALNLKTVLLKYGTYRQNQYLKLLNQSKFVIWVGHTETQGLAQFQAWSMDVPTLVSGLPKSRLEERDGKYASAAPYLSEKTGMLSSDQIPSFAEVSFMISSLDKFSPRSWVISNATQEIATSNLERILND